MSRIGKLPIKFPEGVEFIMKNNKVTIKGKKGELSYEIQPGITVEKKENSLEVTRSNDSREQKSLHGLTRALLQNMVIGVTEGYSKTLQVIGTGYTAEIAGLWLRLNLGYAHEILMEIPEGIEVTAEPVPRREQGRLGVQAVIKVSGIDKEDVGKFAAEIRRCREPENYKGKGIRYEGEYVRIKPGKAGATA
ncbi:MAG: 50S ribosomal protein L6 [Candidatus Cloacimonadota bacterium]|nr:50S ribosomal protein L6 [Candidatus Cloacimonadota bacterium]